MATRRKSPHSHGRSDLWERPRVVRAVKKEQARLGKRLRELRAERGLSQEQAAEKIGIHAKSLPRIEGGTSNITLSTLVAISLAYRVTLADVFGAEPDEA